MNRRWRRSIADIVRHGRSTGEFPEGLDADELGIADRGRRRRARDPGADGPRRRDARGHAAGEPRRLGKLIGFALEPATVHRPPRVPCAGHGARPVLMDVDTGVDDALALLYAVASPEVDLIGASTVMGNISVEQATENTLAVLEAAGRDVEVAQGAAARRRPHPFPVVHGNEDSAEPTRHRRRAGPRTRSAVELIVGSARERPARCCSSPPAPSRTSRSRSARSRTSRSSSAASR